MTGHACTTVRYIMQNILLSWYYVEKIRVHMVPPSFKAWTTHVWTRNRRLICKWKMELQDFGKFSNPLFQQKSVRTKSAFAPRYYITLWHILDGILFPWHYVEDARVLVVSFFQGMKRPCFNENGTVWTCIFYKIEIGEPEMIWNRYWLRY